MNKTTANIDQFHRTRTGKLVFGVIELLLSYVLVSRAIDTGSLWEWLLGILFFIGGLNNLVRIIGKQVRSSAKGKAKKR